MIERSSKVISNYIYNVLYQLFIVFTPLITTPYVSRVLHPEGMGIYSYTYTVATLFSLFAALGINSYGQREIAYHQDNRKKVSKTFYELFLTRVITSLITIGIYLIYVILKSHYQTYFLLQTFYIIAVMTDISWFFQGMEDFKAVAIRNISICTLKLICTFLFVKTEQDLGIYILINTLSTVLSGLVMFASLRSYVDIPDMKTINLKKHLRGNLEFFLPVLSVQLYSQVDKVMLQDITEDAAQNGYYEQARKITNLVVSVIVSLNTVLSSRVSALFAQNEKAKIREIYSKSFYAILMLTIPTCFAMFFMADTFVIWFFGEDYLECAALLKISCPLILLMCVGNFSGVQYLNPTGQQNKGTAIYAISAVLNIAINALLIPRYLSRGALIASIIAEFFSCFAQMYLLLKSEYTFPAFHSVWKLLLSAAVMCGGIYLLDHSAVASLVLKSILEFGTGAVLYFAMLHILHGDEAVREIMARYFHKRR